MKDLSQGTAAPQVEKGVLASPNGLETVSWFHLSDFHFGVGKDYGRDEVLQALLEDMRMFSGAKEPRRGTERVLPDFVLLTGDIAHGGKREEYETALAFFADVRAITGVPWERFFVVPGNHDLDRDEHEPLYMDNIRDPERFEEYWSNPRKRRKIFADKLAAYRTFAGRLNPNLRIPEEQPGGFFHAEQVRGRNVSILGLGSSWLGEGGEGDERRLITGVEQAYDLAGGAGLAGFEESDLSLALIHHPLDWMQAWDGDALTKLLADRVDLFLRGHLHRTGLDWQISPGRELHTLAAGSTFGGRRHRNAYNVVRVSFGEKRRVQVWLRAYAAGEKCFVRDVETYAEVEDGSWEWELGGEVRRATRSRSSAPASEPSPARYLEKLREDHLHLEIRGMGAQVAERMELVDVYTRLRVVAAPDKEEDARGGAKRRRAVKEREPAVGDSALRDRALSDVSSDHPHVVIVGDPGSGKTTFLRFLALNLARALLGEEPEQALKRIGHRGDPPFPVFVRLGPFGQFLQEHPDPSCPAEAPEHFYRYLEHSMRGFPLGLPEGYLRKRVLEGGCMLLLDGLDEVPGDESRLRVARILGNVLFAGKDAGNRHVVTIRTRAFRKGVQLGAGFTRCDLVDFGPAEVEEFVGQWSRALHRVKSGETDTAAATRAAGYRAELLEAIRSHSSVRPLTANPLMLTVLAVVHWNRKQLPEQRAELYDAAVKYLVESRKGLSRYEGPVRLECMRRIALRMFEDPRGPRRTLGKADAAEEVIPLLDLKTRDEALQFLDDEALHSGMLVSRTEGEVEFWHLTFQEYLAALELSSREDYWKFIGDHLFDLQWNEVVLLLAGCLRRLGTERASNMLRSILGQDGSLAGKARAVGLIGRILRDIRPYGGDPAHETGYEEALRDTLDIFGKQSKPVPEATRVEVGEALGQSGDPRPGVEQADSVPIAGGSFWMGGQTTDAAKPVYDREARKDESPVRRVTVSNFRIDRYPVTVAQFREFVAKADDGYLNPRFWDPKGWVWRERDSREHPGGWEDQLSHPNRPVVRVSWYEAEAYARWAGKRLPTEAQWEYAARGRVGRRYPWGDEVPTGRHANFALSVGEPTPVGIYPLGETPEGVCDLAGNVLEWCRDWFGPYQAGESTDPVGPDRGERRVLRGGAFYGNARHLRAAYRNDLHPEVGHDVIGFRCVVLAPGGQSS